MREPVAKTTQVRYACDQCPQTLTTSRGLASHMRVHESPFMCFCQKMFQSIGQLRKHKLSHHPKLHCKTCGGLFNYPSAMEQHRRTKCYASCAICGKPFPELTSLGRHRKKSHMPGTFCRKCGGGHEVWEMHYC